MDKININSDIDIDSDSDINKEILHRINRRYIKIYIIL
jgi:hypothetical protein